MLQPAFYEAFGLTVVESMTCGLPTFATCHGGPAEILEHGISGFHIDPYRPDQASELLVDFFKRCKDDPSHWNRISDCGLERIYARQVFYFMKTGRQVSALHSLQVKCMHTGIRGRSILKG